jgi:uncharacterized membrane protein SpoIIM required for sporulation
LFPRPLRDRRADLARFEALLDECERLRVSQLPFDELRELGRLYRRHAAELARVRARDEDPEAIRHLNALCVRAYTHLYPIPPPEQARAAGLSGRLSLAVARTWRPQLLAWTLLLTGLILGAALENHDPEAIYALVPRSLGYSTGQLDRLVSSPESRADFLAGDETPVMANALFGSALFAHNTRVGFLSFAMGMLAGVPTILFQVYNGLLVGALGSVFFSDPWPFEFLAWILPHGIPEFTAITLCAAAGLLLGGAVALPGRRRRRDTLRDAVEPALLLVGTAIPLFAVAALIESFVRESALATGTRLAVAAAMLAALLAAMLYVRRVAMRVEVDTDWLFETSAPRRSGSPGSGSASPR